MPEAETQQLSGLWLEEDPRRTLIPEALLAVMDNNLLRDAFSDIDLGLQAASARIRWIGRDHYSTEAASTRGRNKVRGYLENKD